MNNRTHLIFALVILLFFPKISLATDSAVPHSIIVTATRLNTPSERVATSVTVIAGEELEKRRGDSISEILESVPGLRIVRSGGAGSPTSATIRGAGAEHTLVMIDGVRMNDPMSPARSFDFSSLSLMDVERVEITRGPESVLYGSDAVGGVVHILTKPGARDRRAKLGLGYGRYGTLEGWGSISGALSDSAIDTRYSLAGKLENSQGYSAANVLHGNIEPDGRQSVSANARVDFDKDGSLPSYLAFQYSDSAFDNDTAGGPRGDDTNYRSTERKWSSSFNISSRHTEEWEPRLALSHSSSRRTARNEPDVAHPDFLDTRYNSKRAGAEAQSDFFLGDQNTISAGLLFERESGNSEENFGAGPSGFPNASAALFAVFLQHQYSSERFFGTAGARLDRHDHFGTQGTYRIAPGYLVSGSGTRLKVSIGTGFKAPSLYQLYSAFGDSTLKPEQSTGYDLGLEQSFGNRESVRASLTYFHLALTNLAEFEPATYRFRNQGAVTSKGIESVISFRVSPALKATLNYTYTHARDNTNGLPLYRRPSHQGSAEVQYDAFGIGSSLRARAVGARDDLDAVTLRRKLMPGYWVCDFSASAGLTWFHRPSKLTLSVKNLLNREYEEVDGYGTPGRFLFIVYEQEF